VIILNTGGTFNKIYDKIAGRLVVPRSNAAVEDILQKIGLRAKVQGLIYKDSLEFDDSDRRSLLQAIIQSGEQSVVVVHGTDTMIQSAQVVASAQPDACVVFTGAMVPYSIDAGEASANLMLAIAKTRLAWQRGVFVAMHGEVASYDRIYKDRQRGVFCLK